MQAHTQPHTQQTTNNRQENRQNRAQTRGQTRERREREGQGQTKIKLHEQTCSPKIIKILYRMHRGLWPKHEPRKILNPGLDGTIFYNIRNVSNLVYIAL